MAAEAAAVDDAEPSADASPERVARLVRAQYAFVWRLLRLGGVEPERERAFLYGVALNVAARARRSLGRRREEPLSAAGEREAQEPDAEQQLERRQARALLDQLLDEMPEELRVVALFQSLQAADQELAMDLLQFVADRSRRASG